MLIVAQTVTQDNILNKSPPIRTSNKNLGWTKFIRLLTQAVKIFKTRNLWQHPTLIFFVSKYHILIDDPTLSFEEWTWFCLVNLNKLVRLSIDNIAYNLHCNYLAAKSHLADSQTSRGKFNHTQVLCQLFR